MNNEPKLPRTSQNQDSPSSDPALDPSAELHSLADIVDEFIRHQHPEWVEADGSCPRCDGYVHELAEEMEGRSSTLTNTAE